MKSSNSTSCGAISLPFSGLLPFFKRLLWEWTSSSSEKSYACDERIVKSCLFSLASDSFSNWARCRRFYSDTKSIPRTEAEFVPKTPSSPSCCVSSSDYESKQVQTPTDFSLSLRLLYGSLVSQINLQNLQIRYPAIAPYRNGNIFTISVVFGFQDKEQIGGKLKFFWSLYSVSLWIQERISGSMFVR